MWFLKKDYLTLLLIPFYRRLTLRNVFPVTINKPLSKCANPHYDYNIYNYLKVEQNLLSLCNVLKLRLDYFLYGMFRFELELIVSPQQWVHLIICFENGSNNVTVSNEKIIRCNDERMCEIVKETWFKGNIVASIKQFSSLYDKGNNILKTKLITNLQCLIYHSVKNDGMAVITNITEHVKKFSNERNEYSVLMTLWYALYSSTLYDDNCLADSFLEDLNFKVYLEPFIPCFGANFLKHDEVGSYQRLIETSLTHDMDNAAGILLRLLFNYYYKTGYFSGCSAVYECCNELDINLTRDQIYKYSLLKKTGIKMKNKSLEIKHPEDFIYKF